MPVAKGGRMIFGDDIARFWSKTKAEGDCIVWTASKDRDGYGKFATGPNGSQKHHRPHRWIYERVMGSAGSILLHSCDNRACVALQHLSIGTQKQNVQETVVRGRRTDTRNRKLDTAAVSRIRDELASGGSRTKIAKSYSVSVRTINRIANGKRA